MQLFRVGVTVIVETIGVPVLLVSVKEGMFPVPEEAIPMAVLLLVQLYVAAVWFPEKLMAPDDWPAHLIISAIALTTGVGLTIIDCVAVVVPHTLVTARLIFCVPGELKKTFPGEGWLEVAGVPLGKVH